ncbi:MAG: VacJ family lipoprotein [Syntrophobacteraceae bacterium]|jgi:phospholipid-binding lipoprotein MlaA
MSNCKYRGIFFFLLFTFFCCHALIGVFGVLPAFAGSGEEVVESGEAHGTTVSDPLEPLNRSVFQANDRLYFWVLKPAATVYSASVPKGFRIAVRNAVKNFECPARFVNCTLQRKDNEANIEFMRFLINSTVGLGGMFDVAQSRFGLSSPHEEDFGQTLAYWGAGSGPFLMLPVLGPSDTRDIFGYAADHTLMDPMFWIPTAWWVDPTVKAGKILNSTSLKLGKYEEFKQSALDPYVSMREAYMQHRANEIKP